MRQTLYLESSVISYRTARASRDLIITAHQQITHQWWEQVLPRYDVFISAVVLEEISKGDAQAAEERMKAVVRFPVLEVSPEVHELAESYFKAIDIAEESRLDTYHLALATWHGMDFLVTWNCAHIASGRVQLIVERINTNRGIRTPIICTPEELMEG